MSGVIGRTVCAVDVALCFAALVTLAVVADYFAHRPELRVRMDATKTRAYSLSEQTAQLLQSLEGQWTIALILAEDSVDAGTRQQVTEVLRRYEEACDAVSVVRVDPTDPETIGEYDALLGRLREQESGEVALHEAALDGGTAAFGALQLFAQQQAVQLEQALAHVDPSEAARAEIQQRLGLLGLLADEGERVLDAVAEAREVSDAQPIPDYEAARSILAQALSQWADELYEMARIYEQWRAQPDGNAVLARFASSVVDDYKDTAQRLAQAAEPLGRLPDLALASIGRQLEGGEAAVIIGPRRSAVIPSEQLFPRLSRRIGDEAVAFDSRFRGEQVISAAMRSLLVKHMPMVVFVHGEETTMFRQAAQRADLVGVATLLTTSRFDVREWSVGNTEKPVAAEGQPVVWIVIPPTRRAGIEPDRPERALIRTAEALIADGEAVMVNVYPSLLPRYRQQDPWQRVAAPFGLRPQTGRAIYEAVYLADGEAHYERGQALDEFAGDHPICRAAHGRQAYFPLPVALERADDGAMSPPHEVLAVVQPSDLRWLEEDWARKMQAGADVERGTPFEQSLPIMIAAERANPIERGTQRFILVGSGGWLLSQVADAARSIGGGRAALVNPGNSELLLASVAWLAQMDELIAPSPVSQQVARLQGLHGKVAALWFVITVVVLPLGCLLFGVIVWTVRRF